MAQFQSPTGAAECSIYIEERNNTTVVLCVASKSGKTDTSTGIKSIKCINAFYCIKLRWMCIMWDMMKSCLKYHNNARDLVVTNYILLQINVISSCFE